MARCCYECTGYFLVTTLTLGVCLFSDSSWQSVEYTGYIFGTTLTFRVRLCSESSWQSRECTGYFLNRYNPDCTGYTNFPSLPGSDKYTGVFLGTILAVRVRQPVRVLLKVDEYKGFILGTALSVGYPNVISFLNNHINIRLFPW